MRQMCALLGEVDATITEQPFLLEAETNSFIFQGVEFANNLT